MPPAPLRALILAAGRGERMRPLTDHTPKPLLVVRGKPLIEWHLLALAAAGVRDVVINTAWLEEQFPAALGDGARFGLRIAYSMEGRDHGGALETAGGIAKALPLLAPSGADEAFWVVSGDVFLPGFAFDAGVAQRFAAGTSWAQLWLVPNAPHHPEGDFGIDAQGFAVAAAPRRTWCSVGLFRAAMFAGVPAGRRLSLRPLFEAGIAQRRIAALPWDGGWIDVGTPERLQAVNAAA
ncbi:MAG: nucleotidyltransferase family protein [Ideonella sp.]|nr:nucleotidyltransferase family protein [Ideonella sp.]MCC7455320.1 nucleotidyltransferase family protein [Nitrospira sp.]